MYAAADGDVVDADFSESSFSGEQQFMAHQTDYLEGGAYDGYSHNKILPLFSFPFIHF